MDLYKIAENINVLSDFLAKRDKDTLSGNDLEEKYQVSQVDMLILLELTFFAARYPSTCVIVLQLFMVSRSVHVFHLRLRAGKTSS